jgi:hypothetical protein
VNNTQCGHGCNGNDHPHPFYFRIQSYHLSLRVLKLMKDGNLYDMIRV